MIKLTTFVALLTVSVLGYAMQPLQPNFSRSEFKILKNAVQSWIATTYPKNITEDKAGRVSDYILETSKSKNIDLELLVGIISTESRFKITALSKEGASGLMQVIPKWHRDKIMGRSIFDPKVSIEVGATILIDCMNRHDQNQQKALACYSGSSGKTAIKYHRTVLANANLFKSHLKLAMFENIEVSQPLVEYAFNND